LFIQFWIIQGERVRFSAVALLGDGMSSGKLVIKWTKDIAIAKITIRVNALTWLLTLSRAQLHLTDLLVCWSTEFLHQLSKCI
jgi:hypothetical protein